MHKLPPEILFPIFELFTIQDKIQCSLVSKQWRHWLNDNKLIYKTIVIIDNAAKFKQALLFFQTHQEFSNQVQELELIECEIASSTFVRLPKLFPFVRKLRFMQDEQFGYEFSKMNKDLNQAYFQNQVQTWQHLRFIEEHNVCFFPFTIALLASSLKQPQLTHITLNYHSLSAPYHHPYWGSILIHRKQTLIDGLKNVPHLRELVLHHLHLTIDDIENIHAHAPSLESLTLNNIKFKRHLVNTRIHSTQEIQETYSDISNYVKNTVTQVKEIKSSCFRSSLSHGPRFMQNQMMAYAWLEYLRYKYSNIVHLTLVYNNLHSMVLNEQDTARLESSIVSVLSRSQKLLSYDVMFCSFSDAIVACLDEHHIRLESLALYTRHDDLLLENQLMALARSNQSQCIRSLRLVLNEEGIYPWATHTSAQHLAVLKELTQLRQIEIESPVTVNISILFNLARYAPQVERIILPTLIVNRAYDTYHLSSSLFHISCPHVTYTSNQLGTIQLKHLEIKECSVLDITEASLFNQLLELVLSQCHQLETFYFKLGSDSFLSNRPPEDPLALCSLKFDFSASNQLREIEIKTQHKYLYNITREGQPHSDYFVFDSRHRCFSKIPKVHHTKYHTTLVIGANAYPRINQFLFLEKQ
ncbi:hypothetical protein A0J61_04532 [Choanephora cucurbitarum]|uniref:F-box domain-containing protein n=1 Tax=Choanephora cucurbitarum TaxID=101091 RepID=A0A1C7NF86_9FUNG|nr:hypothetical protein A0J61_04532 [Choanephora cucurbitarum]